MKHYERRDTCFPYIQESSLSLSQIIVCGLKAERPYGRIVSQKCKVEGCQWPVFSYLFPVNQAGAEPVIIIIIRSSQHTPPSHCKTEPEVVLNSSSVLVVMLGVSNSVTLRLSVVVVLETFRDFSKATILKCW